MKKFFPSYFYLPQENEFLFLFFGYFPSVRPMCRSAAACCYLPFDARLWSQCVCQHLARCTSAAAACALVVRCIHPGATVLRLVVGHLNLIFLVLVNLIMRG